MVSDLAFRSGRILGASWASGQGEAAAERLRGRLDGWAVVAGEGWLLATESGCDTGEGGSLIAATTGPRLFDRSAACLRDARQLAECLDRDAATTLASLGPPFRLVWVDRATGAIHAATDSVGLGPLFWHQDEGIAVCASSARLLAGLFGLDADPVTIAAFALFGTFPFSQTPFVDVTRLVGGTRLRLLAGRAKISQLPASNTAVTETVDEAFVSAVSAMAAAAPDAAFEVSGGLDSRLILSALPDAVRRGRRGMTLDESGGHGADARAARVVSERTGLRHEIVVPDLANAFKRQDLDEMLARVVDGYDAMANPIDKLPLVIAADCPETARFGGQNGEIIRGFYYPMQPLAQQPSSQLISALVDWRLIANDRVMPSLFSHDFMHGPLARARQAMIDELGRFSGSWGDVLDQTYLHFRMQAWVGNSAGNRFLGRTVLWPFFDQRFLAAAMRVDAARKRDSLLPYQMLCRFDRDLAAIPLDSGIVPLAMAAGGLDAKITRLRAKGVKGARKLWQRLRPRSTSVLGSQRIVDEWHDRGGYRRIDVPMLSSLGMFNEATLMEIASGQLKPDRATLGFLLLCGAWMRP